MLGLDVGYRPRSRVTPSMPRYRGKRFPSLRVESRHRIERAPGATPTAGAVVLRRCDACHVRALPVPARAGATDATRAPPTLRSG